MDAISNSGFGALRGVLSGASCWRYSAISNGRLAAVERLEKEDAAISVEYSIKQDLRSVFLNESCNVFADTPIGKGTLIQRD